MAGFPANPNDSMAEPHPVAPSGQWNISEGFYRGICPLPIMDFPPAAV